eukprot:TRINITY_DN4803_c0_g1_i10.p1 TRINITY_DN4803_c0_g1~~TRINITY_DN4803_c0_g1_i10.p1  ORF type:complete len:334 (+),score=104.15 TRINITY_DN4803_c0_g1_i10:40-1041(+)
MAALARLSLRFSPSSPVLRVKGKDGYDDNPARPLGRFLPSGSVSLDARPRTGSVGPIAPVGGVAAFSAPPGQQAAQQQPTYEALVGGLELTEEIVELVLDERDDSGTDNVSRRLLLLRSSAAFAAILLGRLVMERTVEPARAALVGNFRIPPIGFRLFLDRLDGYSFFYPDSWIDVRGSALDSFFRNPLNLDENICVEISSPSSSRFQAVGDLGSPAEAGERILQQFLVEFMSTRLGVQRESSLLSSSLRVGEDEKDYYDIEINVKSFASTNQLAILPEERPQTLEWDRRYITVLGVENSRLYQLRLQAPEKNFTSEEPTLRAVMSSFRVFNA